MLGRRNSKCKASKAGTYLAGWRSNKWAGDERRGGDTVGDVAGVMEGWRVRHRLWISSSVSWDIIEGF